MGIRTIWIFEYFENTIFLLKHRESKGQLLRKEGTSFMSKPQDHFNTISSKEHFNLGTQDLFCI